MSKTAQSRKQARTNGATRRQKRRTPWLTPAVGAAAIAGAATVIAAVVTGFFAMVHTLSGPASTATASSAASPTASPVSLPHSRIPGDKSTFIKDVTFPDNSVVSPGQRFIKEWELENSGSVRWVDRYLIPSLHPTGNCTYPSRVRVPSAKPGQTVIIRVPVVAESTPGLCFVTWKMVNGSGALYFPGYLGIWFEVKVLNPTVLPSDVPNR